MQPILFVAKLLKFKDRSQAKSILSQQILEAEAPIKNSDGIYKIRSGTYRIAYQIIDERLIVLVVRVGHRSDFYRFYDNK